MGRLGAMVVAVLVALGSTTLGLVTAPVVSSETSPAAGSPSFVQPRLASFDDTYVEAGTITVSGGGSANPATLAIDETDDTVYVANYNVGTVEVLAPGQVSGVPVATVQVKASGDARLAGIAVDSDDDTIFVTDRTEGLPKQIWAINGRTLTVDDTVSVPCIAGFHNDAHNWEIAVNSRTNTLYVPCNSPNPEDDQRIVALNTANLDDSSYYERNGYGGYTGIAIDPTDDTVYVAGEGVHGQRVQNLAPANPPPSPLTLARDDTAGGALNDPMGVTVLDDTLYVTNIGNPNLVAINPASGASVTKVLPRNQGTDVAAFAGRDLLFVTSNTQNLWIVSAPDLTLRQTFSFSPTGFRAWSVVVSSSGIAYVGSRNSDSGAKVVKVFGPAAAGAPTAVSGVAGFEQVPVTWMGPSYPGASSIQRYLVTASPGGNTCISQAPVTTCVVGGLTAGTPYTFTVQAMNSTGTWGPASSPSGPVTPLAPPNPGPVFPPSAPVGVVGVPGDREVAVSWQPPVSVGSFPVTDYLVTAGPGGQTCLAKAPALTCTVTGLANGTAYTFVVTALNGAGWGAGSQASGPVTPSAQAVRSLTLFQGTRAADGRHDRIRTGGTSVGVPAGSRLTPWIRYGATGEFKQGVASIVVDDKGGFTWTRQIRKDKAFHAYVAFEDLESNRVIWQRVR